MTPLGSSPPTQRVIAVMECLSASESGYTATELANTLGTARPTTSAILRELEAAGWVARDTDTLAYAVSGRFLALTRPGIADDEVRAILEELSATLNCGLTLSRVEPDQLVVVHKVPSPTRTIRGLNVGEPVALCYPTGAAVMAWRSSTDQQRWLGGRDARDLRERRRLLRSVRTRGVVLYRPDEEDSGLLDVLIDLLDAAGADGQRREVQIRVYRQIQRLVSRTFTDAEIDAAEVLPLGYLTTPVFDAAGHARYELQVAPLRGDVDGSERQRYITETVRAAERLRGIG